MKLFVNTGISTKKIYSHTFFADMFALLHKLLPEYIRIPSSTKVVNNIAYHSFEDT